MILQKKNIHMVKVYDNIIPSVTCKRLLDLFEKNTEYHEYINDNHCPCFTQLNLNELSQDTVSTLIPLVLKVYQKYKEDIKSKYIPPFALASDSWYWFLASLNSSLAAPILSKI